MILGRIVSVRFGAIGVYAFALTILYLAAAYIGPLFVFLFSIFLLVPVGSLLMVFVTTAAIRYNQEFSTDHPLKGEQVVYTLSVSKEAWIPSGPIRLRLVGTQQGMNIGLDDIDIYPAANSRFTFSHSVQCPFRGVYIVGLESIEIRGYFGWFSYFLPAWVRTFYVYPRIIELRRSPFGEEGTSVALPGITRGGEEDYTLLESLDQYRPGEPVRHMSWKKFASSGQPALRRYESSSQPGVTIILDTRGSGDRSVNFLEMEDCSIEILVAVVKYFVDRDVPVQVLGDGIESFHFAGRDEPQFRKFHQATVGIFFQSKTSPIQVLQEQVLVSRFAPGSVLFITHLADPDILSVCDRSSSAIPAAAILNLSGMSPVQRERAESGIVFLRDRGGSIRVVHSAMSIAEDLWK